MKKKSIHLTILVDNSAQPGLSKEHGFAVLVEAFGHTILFDTGQGTALLQNATELRCELHRVEVLVLSHGHYDHTGGLAAVLGRTGPGIGVYCHADVLQPRYGFERSIPKAVGMPAASLAALNGLSTRQVHWIEATRLLSEVVGLTGPIPRETGYEDAGGPLFLDAEGRCPDPFRDDQALWIRTAEGLIIVAGCAHAGIINTLQYVCQATGEVRIRAVIGGFHLLHAAERRLDSTMEALLSLGPETIVPCHCTGNRALERLTDAFGLRVSRGFAGMRLDFPET